MCTRLNTGSSHSIEFFSAVYADIFSIYQVSSPCLVFNAHFLFIRYRHLFNCEEQEFNANVSNAIRCFKANFKIDVSRWVYLSLEMTYWKQN